MRVQLLTVTELLEQVASNELEDFVDAYPGMFLMAMGLLSAEVIRAKSANSTMAISLGGSVKHDLSQNHPLAGCAFFLTPEGDGELTVGRSGQCTITVPEPSVSDLHCSLSATVDRVELVDLGSKNGTSVNLKPVSPGTTVSVGDEEIISLGRYSFQVMSARALYSELKLLQLVKR